MAFYGSFGQNEASCCVALLWRPSWSAISPPSSPSSPRPPSRPRRICRFLSGLFQPTAKSLSVEELTNKTKPSIVVILHTGRQGKQAGLGTGFVVGDGLIATNFHVIGEARPITVQTSRRHQARSHQRPRLRSPARSRRHQDRRQGPEAAPARRLRQAEGRPADRRPRHPLGLKYSVVAGVLSGKREIEGRRDAADRDADRTGQQRRAASSTRTARSSASCR